MIKFKIQTFAIAKKAQKKKKSVLYQFEVI